MRLANEGKKSQTGATYINRYGMATVHGHVASSELEHLLGVLLGTDAHVLLAESPHLGVDVVVGLSR